MSASFCDCVNQWEQVLGLQVLKDTKHLSVRKRRGLYWNCAPLALHKTSKTIMHVVCINFVFISPFSSNVKISRKGVKTKELNNMKDLMCSFHWYKKSSVVLLFINLNILMKPCCFDAFVVNLSSTTNSKCSIILYSLCNGY